MEKEKFDLEAFPTSESAGSMIVHMSVSGSIRSWAWNMMLFVRS